MRKFINIIKLKLIILISILISLYLFEVYQIFFDTKSGYKEIVKQYYNETGKIYDERTKYEIFSDLKNTDQNISVSIYPMSHLKKSSLNIFPLSGISNVE